MIVGGFCRGRGGREEGKRRGWVNIPREEKCLTIGFRVIVMMVVVVVVMMVVVVMVVVVVVVVVVLILLPLR